MSHHTGKKKLRVHGIMQRAVTYHIESLLFPLWHLSFFLYFIIFMPDTAVEPIFLERETVNDRIPTKIPWTSFQHALGESSAFSEFDYYSTYANCENAHGTSIVRVQIYGTWDIYILIT